MICWLAPQTAMAATAEFACKPKHWCHITIKKQVCSDYDVGRMAKRLLFISTQGVWLDKRKHDIETVENMQAVLDQEALIEAAREKAAEEQAAKEHAAKIKAAINQISGIAPSADQASDDGISDDQAGADTESGGTPSDDPADTLVFTATQVLSGDDDADKGAPKTAMLFKQGKKLISQVTSHQQTDISVFECTVIKNTTP